MNRGSNHCLLNEQRVKSPFPQWTEGIIHKHCPATHVARWVCFLRSWYHLGIIVFLFTVLQTFGKSKFAGFQKWFQSVYKIRMYQNRSEVDCKRDFSSPNSSKTQKIFFSERKILNIDSKSSISQTSGLNRYPYVMWIFLLIPNWIRRMMWNFYCLLNEQRSCPLEIWRGSHCLLNELSLKRTATLSTNYILFHENLANSRKYRFGIIKNVTILWSFS